MSALRSTLHGTHALVVSTNDEQTETANIKGCAQLQHLTISGDAVVEGDLYNHDVFANARESADNEHFYLQTADTQTVFFIDTGASVAYTLPKVLQDFTPLCFQFVGANIVWLTLAPGDQQEFGPSSYIIVEHKNLATQASTVALYKPRHALRVSKDADSLRALIKLPGVMTSLTQTKFNIASVDLRVQTVHHSSGLVYRLTGHIKLETLYVEV